MRYLTFLALFGIYSCGVAAQSTAQADSLKRLLSISPPAQHAYLYRLLGKHYLQNKQLDSGFLYIKKAQQIATSMHDLCALGIAKGLEASYHYRRADAASSVAAYDEAILLLQQTDSLIRLAQALTNAASIAGTLGDRKNAIRFGRMLQPYEDTLYTIAPRILYEGYNLLGVNLRNDGDRVASDYFLEKAVSINRIKSLGNPYALINLGSNAAVIGEYEKGERLLLDALEMCQQRGDHYSTANTMIAIGDLFAQAGRHNEALTWYNNSMQLCKEHDLSNLRRLNHLVLGDAYFSLGQKEQALPHYQASAKLAKDQFDPVVEASALAKIGLLESRAKKLLQARSHALKAIQIADEAKVVEAFPQILMDASEVFIATKEYHLAIQTCQKAIKIVKKNNLLSIASQANTALAEAYKAAGDTLRALELSLQSYKVKNSLETSQGEMLRHLSVRLATQEQEQKLAEQALQILQKEKSAQNRFLWGLCATLIACGLLAAWYYNRNKLLNTRNILLSTEKKALEDQLAAQQKTEMLKAMNYAVGHDLKAPLANAERFLDLLDLQLSKTPNGDITQRLSHFRVLLGDMRQMIEGINAYAQADGLELSQNNINTTGLISSIVGRLEFTYPFIRQSLHLEHLPDLYGDTILIRQVLVNLIENALKFSQHATPPTIWVSGEILPDGMVRLQIRDNGLGISPEAAERIFDLFYSAHQRQGRSSGMGLAIARRIVERHGGQIWAESKGLGHGAAFFFTLPAPK